MDQTQPLLINSEPADIGFLPVVTDSTAHLTEQPPNLRKPWIPCRYVLMFLTSLGFLNFYMIRTSFNLALVAMVNVTTTDSWNDTADECPGDITTNATKLTETGEFAWSPTIQSILLGCFYYGYPLAQPVGGFVAEKFGAKKVFAISIGLSGVLNLVTPIVARWDVNVLIAVRVFLGFAMGPIYPACGALWGKWAPPQERSRAIAISFAGSILGEVFGDAFTGALCASSFLGGWPSVFYVSGVFALLWTVIWMLFVYDSPRQHPRISQQELDYIEEGTKNIDTLKYHNPPVCKMLTSLPVWAFVLTCLMDSTGFYIIFSYAPLFMKQILKFDITQNGLLLSLPYIANFIGTIAGGFIGDFLIARHILSITATRKICVFIGMGGLAACLLGMGYSDCDRVLAISFLVLGYFINGVEVAGHASNMLDIAPMYAGTILGLGNGLGNVGGFIAPIMVEAITQGQPSRSRWQYVFWLCASIYTAGVLIFCLFGSGKEQPWARQEVAEDTIQVVNPEEDNEHEQDSGER